VLQDIVGLEGKLPIKSTLGHKAKDFKSPMRQRRLKKDLVLFGKTSQNGLCVAADEGTELRAQASRYNRADSFFQERRLR
jgi:hypothetical protein